MCEWGLAVQCSARNILPCNCMGYAGVNGVEFKCRIQCVSRCCALSCIRCLFYNALRW